MAGISRAAFMDKMASGHVVASGDCDHLTYIRLILSLVEHKMSGTFQLSFQRRSRTLYVLGGRPVAYKSDLPGEQLNKSLAAAGVVNRSQLQWIEERLGAEESLEAALLQSGAIDEKALANHARYQIRQGLSSAVQWRASKWRFESCSTPLARNVDPALFLDLPILEAAWYGVKQFVTIDEIFPVVNDASAGDVKCSSGFSERFSILNEVTPLADLETTVGDGCSVEALFTGLPDRTGNLVKLLWFLEISGLIERSNDGQIRSFEDGLSVMMRGLEPDRPKEQKAKTKAKTEEVKADGGPEPAGRESDAGGSRKRSKVGRGSRGDRKSNRIRATRDPKKVINVDARRLGRDFYAFLGIPNDSDEDTIRRTCMRLAKRWQAAIGSGSLSAEMTANAEQLLTGSQLVWRTLTDPDKKAEYDRRLANGRAPIVESTTENTERPGQMESDSIEEGGGTTAANTPLDQANELMAQGQFGAAVPILNKARLASPSDPDVLAALGWASLRAGVVDSSSEDESSEDYIRLALTFDPGNLRALEYYARLAVEQGNITAARKRLQRYIARAPNAAWARKALAELPDGDPDDAKGKGRRIWRRGGER